MAKILGTDIVTPAELQSLVTRLENAEKKLALFAHAHMAAAIGIGVSLIALVVLYVR